MTSIEPPSLAGMRTTIVCATAAGCAVRARIQSARLLHRPYHKSLQALHRVRERLVGQRTGIICAGLEIEFELDGVFVGAISNGEMDSCLSIGLLGEWRRHLFP